MFKGKKGIYILIPLNILIWSFFVYRFYSLYTEDEISVVNGVNDVVKFESLKDSAEYTLIMNYQDPFLKKEPKGRMQKQFVTQSTKTPAEKVQTPKKQKEPEKAMPDIKYLGLVKNNSNGTVTAIVSINGASKLIRQDEMVNGLCFKNFTNDNLTVLWNKEKILISK